MNKHFGYKTTTTISFTDVPRTHKYYNDISIDAKAEYINVKNTTFNPDGLITREEASAIVTTIMNCKDSNLDKLSKYTDADKVSSWAKTSVEGAIERGYLGQGSTEFRPQGFVSTKDLDVILSRLK